MSPRRLLGLVLATALTVSLAACSSSGDGAGSSGAGGAGFPVTVEHVYGTTTIESKPERVATVAWANHEVPLALGVVPVGMSKAAWGDDNGNGVLPWVEDELKRLGAPTPELFDETDGIDYEAVADTRPDVILASYSGLSKEEYDKLSKIAPVVAYPKTAWGTSWQDMVRMNSKAIGRQAEGDRLIEKLTGQVNGSLDKHPELKGRKVMFAYLDPTDLSKIGFYTTHDTRQGFLDSVGMAPPAEVAAKSAGTDEFYVEESAEQAERFRDVDLVVTYGDDSTVARLKADPLLSKIPAIAAGHVAILKDATPLAAMANPSPLSIPWGIDDYFSTLAAGLTDK
ncbi:ABC transporter substrate-binding protein [Gordonia sihwensis]|uniref:iron-siderophore ABC transporter substrate-binding protein n=1 Tax=Gordonia TaxID=2053 RepID=UPI0007843764|nr:MULTISPECIES: iron-siderophore ABC transporter substrate-binding protein [Gordonia]KXT57514.1 ABC transporter substrate-binding protein [Gordonia sp. QH-12]MBY4570318.1 ABC transporter substrate-binding protein [Gordonia sihwensis]